MNALTVLKALGPIDGRNLRRDSMLFWMLFGPLFMALALRFLLPWAAAGVQRQWALDLRPYFPLLFGFLILLCPVIYGIVVGFLLLDERDDHTLLALQVTPLPLSHYAVYRISVPVLVGILITPLALWIAGDNSLTTPQMLFVAAASAPMAPLYMFFLAVFAANKVQGLALMKATNIFLMAPVAVWFVPMPWQLLLGVLPPYWPVRLYWMLAAGEPGIWLYAGAGFFVQTMFVFALWQRFNKVMHR